MDGNSHSDRPFKEKLTLSRLLDNKEYVWLSYEEKILAKKSEYEKFLEEVS